MSYSKLIHEYLDRQLGGANEDALFSELARDPELRVEFNQQVQIQSVASSDMAMISPPAESTSSIFSALNFSIPSAELLNRVPIDRSGLSNNSNLLNTFKKHLTTIMAILITAGLTTSVFLFTGDYLGNKSTLNVAQKNAIPTVSSIDNTNLAANQASMINQSINNTVTPIAHKRYNKNIININSAIENNNNEASVTNILSMSSSINSNHQNLSSIAESNNVNFNSALPIQYEPFMTDFIPQRNFNDGKFALIASFSNTNSSVNVNLPTENFYKNFNLSAMYKVWDNLYLGVQIGQEQIAQNFQRVIGEGLNYQQNFAFIYYGGLVKYSLPLSFLGDYSRYASAYGQLFTGSTKYGGILVRPQIGLSFSPYNMWTFNVGYEFINYNYYVDNNWNMTNKSGLTFGTGISF